ncbi:prepilin-type N-terminal cleavage/methylation domain-containing protein [Escherichia coli]
MSASLKNQQGFSLPEVMVAMVLMVMIVTALSGIQRTLMNSLASGNQYQQLWRHGWQQTQLRAISPPANWQVNRMQTSQAGCQHQRYASFTGAQKGEMTRLHCPNRRSQEPLC